MFLATCLVTLNTKSLNLTKVAAKALNARQDNFKIIEDVENVDHLHGNILKF
jgi:hypothetical protein